MDILNLLGGVRCWVDGIKSKVRGQDDIPSARLEKVVEIHLYSCGGNVLVVNGLVAWRTDMTENSWKIVSNF